MKQNIIVLLLICTVSSSYIRNRHIRKRQIDNSFIPLEEYNTRFKRAHNPRDFKTITGPRNIIRVVYGLNVTQSADPCDPYVVPKDFSFPGRRISEAKCLEYIWDLKAHHEKLERERECFRVMIENYLADNPDLSENDIVGVVGGQDADPAEFPHMGAIGWESYEGTWIFKCGGSLISHNFVLTAAHCKSTSPRDDTVADVEPKIVRFGDTNIIDSESLQHKYRDISIARIIVHPKYDSPKKYYDIALMELKESVTFTKFIRPACLWTKNSIREFGKQGTVTGWGVVKSGGAQSYPELQAANIDFLESDVCNKYLSPQYNRIFWGFEDHQLCAGVLTGGIDACQGDSGGPLQVKIPLPYQSQGHMHYLVGIIASGIKCGLENTPGIYTRVSSFLDWIEPIVWPNETIPRHS